MKILFDYKKLLAAIACSLVLITTACDTEKVEPDPTSELTKISSAHTSGTRVELYAEGTLFAGYNPVTIFLYDSTTGKLLSDVDISLYPEMDMGTMKHSCPVENPTKGENGQFEGAIIFTMPSGEMGTWTVAVDFTDQHDHNRKGTALMDVEVAPTSPSSVLSFQTEQEDRYYLSYYFPEKMRVGVNRFIVIAYTSKGGEFVPAENLSIELTPEMPSMDHGSPNNEHPVHTNGGHYEGKVNFTMTGEWRLHLKLSSGDAAIANKYFDVVVP